MGLFVENAVWNFASLCVLLTVAFLAYIKWKQTYWNRKGIPTPKTHFLLGSSAHLITQKQSFGEAVAATYQKFKKQGLKYCGYYIILKPFWMLLDLDLIKDVMTKDFIHFTDHGNYVNEENDPLTGQLFMQNGKKWKNLRAKLSPTFTTGKMKMMFPTLLDCSHELINVMNQAAVINDAVDIKDIVARYTTDIIGSCAFGIDCNSLKDPQSEFRYFGKMVFEGSTKQAFKQALATSFPWILDIFKIPLFPQVVIDFFLKIVKETVSFREKNNIMRRDFMHLLIQLKHNIQMKDDERTDTSIGHSNGISDGTAFTIEEMTAQAFVFFLAGFETSSTTLSFCFYEMVSNPKIQEQLREEINSVYEKYNGELTYESLAEMKYMEKCINETLRKYPPLPILVRECTETYRVRDSNLIIEKGTRVMIPILGIQHDPEYYPDPEKFDPERFSQEQKSQRHPFSWLPFGEGPRICIGLRFGMMQTKVALSILLRKYKFSFNSKTTTPLVMDPKHFIMSTKGGIWLNVEKIAEN